MLCGCHCRKFLVEDRQVGRRCGLNKRGEGRHSSALPVERGAGCGQARRAWIKKLSSGEKTNSLDSAMKLIISISEDVTEWDVGNPLVFLYSSVLVRRRIWTRTSQSSALLCL